MRSGTRFPVSRWTGNSGRVVRIARNQR